MKQYTGKYSDFGLLAKEGDRRNYDCAGHYLKDPNNATIAEITTNI